MYNHPLQKFWKSVIFKTWLRKKELDDTLF